MQELVGCFPTGTYNCSYGELPLRQPFARRHQEVLPFQAGTFCLVARGLSPGDYDMFAKFTALLQVCHWFTEMALCTAPYLL